MLQEQKMIINFKILSFRYDLLDVPLGADRHLHHRRPAHRPFAAPGNLCNLNEYSQQINITKADKYIVISNSCFLNYYIKIVFEFL